MSNDEAVVRRLLDVRPSPLSHDEGAAITRLLVKTAASHENEMAEVPGPHGKE